MTVLPDTTTINTDVEENEGSATAVNTDATKVVGGVTAVNTDATKVERMMAQ